MLEKEAPTVFEDLIPEQLAAFPTLIEDLTTVPILHLHWPRQPYSINMDA